MAPWERTLRSGRRQRALLIPWWVIGPFKVKGNSIGSRYDILQGTEAIKYLATVETPAWYRSRSSILSYFWFRKHPRNSRVPSKIWNGGEGPALTHPSSCRDLLRFDMIKSLCRDLLTTWIRDCLKLFHVFGVKP